MNNFMIWYPYSQLHTINFMECIILFHKQWYMNLLSLLWPNIVMFDDFGDHFVIHGFWCVQIPIMQYWEMDHMMAIRSRCVQHPQKLVVFHNIYEMGHCPRTIVNQGSEWPRSEWILKNCANYRHQVWHCVQWFLHDRLQPPNIHKIGLEDSWSC